MAIISLFCLRGFLSLPLCIWCVCMVMFCWHQGPWISRPLYTWVCAEASSVCVCADQLILASNLDFKQDSLHLVLKKSIFILQSWLVHFFFFAREKKINCSKQITFFWECLWSFNYKLSVLRIITWSSIISYLKPYDYYQIEIITSMGSGQGE